MKKILLFLITILFIGAGCSSQKQPVSVEQDFLINKNMKLTSPAFEHNGSIPSQYTCDGANINPALQIAEIPEGAQSLVLIMDDPDAPMGTWVHWTIWNIDPKITEIAENSVPSGGVEGITSFGKSGYGGPCPPSGTHHYVFKLYALDTKLDLAASIDAKSLEQAMSGHVLDQVELIGLYSRG